MHNYSLAPEWMTNMISTRTCVSVCLVLAATAASGCSLAAPTTVDHAGRQPLPGGVLELHVLVDRSTDTETRWPFMVASFEEAGPEGWPFPLKRYEVDVNALQRQLDWFEVAMDTSDLNPRVLVLAEWKGRTYVVARTEPEYSLDSRTAWQVEHFESGTPHPSLARVVFELDEGGAKRVAELTRDNLGKTLGVFVHGRLRSAATIHSEVANKVAITGSQEHIDRLYDTLQRTVTAP